MAQGYTTVPYGYVPDEPEFRGTLVVLGDYADELEALVNRLAQFAEERKFERVVLFPQHEQTLKRLKIREDRPYYSRVDLLEETLEELQVDHLMTVDKWEGKRKKYTPIDAVLRFAAEGYAAPLFIGLPERYANIWAEQPEFDGWIRKARFVLLPEKLAVHSGHLHPKWHEVEHRWEWLPPS